MKNKELINKILRADKVFYLVGRGKIVIQIDQLSLIRGLNVNPDEESPVRIYGDSYTDGLHKIHLRDT